MQITLRLLPLFIIMASGFLVAIADGLIKHISVNTTSVWDAMRSPLMIPVGFIYLFAIVAFSFAFIRKWDLSIIGVMQIIIYAAAVVMYGVLVFHERITPTHGIGMVLAVVAAVLMNL